VAKSYRDLKVWQSAMQLAQSTYGILTDFPRREAQGLIWQLQRAAVSVPSNIAEGHARNSTKEYLHFLSIALGSLAELETQIILASRLRFLSDTKAGELLDVAADVGKMLRTSAVFECAPETLP
jgi:four helix bundle protein